MKFGGTQAKGFGRMSTLSEVSLVFYYAGPTMDPSFVVPSGAAPNSGWSKWDTAHPSSRYALVDATTQRVKSGFMRAFLLFSTFDPMQGYAPKTDPGFSDPKLSIECQWPQGDWQVAVQGAPPSTWVSFPLRPVLPCSQPPSIAPGSPIGVAAMWADSKASCTP